MQLSEENAVARSAMTTSGVSKKWERDGVGVYSPNIPESKCFSLQQGYCIYRSKKRRSTLDIQNVMATKRDQPDLLVSKTVVAAATKRGAAGGRMTRANTVNRLSGWRSDFLTNERRNIMQGAPCPRLAN